jgi:hypothetical protein
MKVINRAACSPEFIREFDRLNAGGLARRSSWQAGMHLRANGDRIVVVRPGSEIAPPWLGPSSAEMDADDWCTYVPSPSEDQVS